MAAFEALKAFVKVIVLPYLVPLIGFLLAILGALPPVLEKWSAKRELVCTIVRSVPEKRGREVTIRVTNRGQAQLVPGEHARIRFFFGNHAVIHQVVAKSGIQSASVAVEQNYVVVTPPFLNACDSFSFMVHLQDHRLFQATSHIEGIQHIWWERTVPWKRRVVNRDLLFLGYDIFLAVFLVTLPWQVTVFRAVAPFAWIAGTQWYPLLLLVGLLFLGIGLWLYLSRLVRGTRKSLRLVVRHPGRP